MAANQISPLRPVVGPKLALANIGNEHYAVQHTHAHAHTRTPLQVQVAQIYASRRYFYLF